jgi:hypothetical protein
VPDLDYDRRAARRLRRSLMTDDEKVQRLIDEGVFDAELPDDYRDVIKALTPNEVEAISSINKRVQQVQKLKPGDPGIDRYAKF